MKEINLSNYKAVILAGGEGTRLYPITKEIPKPLLPVNKKPIINYLIDLFFTSGIQNIAILINKNLREEFNWWQKRYYDSASLPKALKIKIFEEEKPLGTFGGLWYLKKWISENSFFLTNGDELKDINLLKMANFHKNKEATATIALVKLSNPQEYGVVICKKGLIQDFLEKPKDPPSKYINAGLYLFSPEIFNYHQGPKFTMVERDIFPKLAQMQKLAGFKFQGKWIDCGTWEKYKQALEEWK